MVKFKADNVNIKRLSPGTFINAATTSLFPLLKKDIGIGTFTKKGCSPLLIGGGGVAFREF